MKCITLGLQTLLQKTVPQVYVAPLSGKPRGKLRLSPEQLLAVIHAWALAGWELALVQTVWRKSYEQIVDYVVTHEGLAIALGFTQRMPTGGLRTICKGRYWERRAALGLLPFLFFFLGLVGQLIRLGVITGKVLIVDSTLIAAWYHADPGASWQKYARKKAVFGCKVHTVLCQASNLPVFMLVTPAHVHDSQVGWFIILVALCCMGSRCRWCTPMRPTSTVVACSGSFTISWVPIRW
jgi:hypothetical protein